MGGQRKLTKLSKPPLLSVGWTFLCRGTKTFVQKKAIKSWQEEEFTLFAA
jgi:hypothetical protein